MLLNRSERNFKYGADNYLVRTYVEAAQHFFILTQTPLLQNDQVISGHKYL